MNDEERDPFADAPAWLCIPQLDETVVAIPIGGLDARTAARWIDPPGRAVVVLAESEALKLLNALSRYFHERRQPGFPEQS